MKKRISLNPYSIGIWSATLGQRSSERGFVCLNPYSIGIWSATAEAQTHTYPQGCLNPYSIGIWSATFLQTKYYKIMNEVLILILLEYGLRQWRLVETQPPLIRLNPYSIGIWSATPKIANH